MSRYLKTVKKIAVYYITVHIGIVILVLIGGMFLAALHPKSGLLKNKHTPAEGENRWFGIETMEINPALVRQFNIHSSRGLLVTRVFRGSTAESAGIKSGDVIRRCNGISILSHKHFQWYIEKTKTDKKNKIIIDRDGAPLIISVKLGWRPGNFQ